MRPAPQQAPCPTAGIPPPPGVPPCPLADARRSLGICPKLRADFVSPTSVSAARRLRAGARDLLKLVWAVVNKRTRRVGCRCRSDVLRCWRMDALDLTNDQRHELVGRAADARDWYTRLLTRMEARQWRRDDPVYLAAVAAREAADALVRALYAVAYPTAPHLPSRPERGRPAWMAAMSQDAQAPPPEGLPDLAGLPWVGKPRGRRRR